MDGVAPIRFGDGLELKLCERVQSFHARLFEGLRAGQSDLDIADLVASGQDHGDLCAQWLIQ